jgi:hypothetical protein
MSGRGLSQILLAIVLAAMATFIVADLAGGWGTFPNARWASLIAALCLAVWIGPGLLRRYSGNASGALKAIVIWLAIACVVALGYAWFGDNFRGTY